jgi:fused signal recognition particle receptor
VIAARSRDIDAVIIDTAGRLHTKINLMEELKKVKRSIDKAMPGAPQEILLVVDATTGQNALRQADLFNQAVGITGIALTKLDGTAKGGIVFAIRRGLGIPVRLIGVGEGIDDLRDFDPGEFVEALFS